MTLQQKIQAYYGNAAGEHHRYRSWEHCYRYFRSARAAGGIADRDCAALHLAFYLASWGMYRGSSFLLGYAYTVHRGVVDLVAQPRFGGLWTIDFGANQTDLSFVPAVLTLVEDIRNLYKPFALDAGSSNPTDTLIPKVILGTIGCLPACDYYFVKGFKSEGNKYSYLNRRFVERVHGYCQANLADLRREQAAIAERSDVRYPLMKLVDMYFWQVGLDLESG